MTLEPRLLNESIEAGLVDPESLFYLKMRSLSERYGWAPDVIKRQDLFDLAAYDAMAEGERRRVETGGKPSMSKHQEKGMLYG